MYISKITFPGFSTITLLSCQRMYPMPLLVDLNLDEISLDPITILYGNNGSGKTTILNLIAEKLKCSRKHKLFKEEGWFYDCKFVKPIDVAVENMRVKYFEDETHKIDKYSYYESTIICSDDIFNILNNKREFNNQALSKRRSTIDETNELLSEKITNFMNDDEKFFKYLKARKNTKKYIQETITPTKEQFSNGETALDYYTEIINKPGIYLIDEPENCLSPIFQLKLANLIKDAVENKECQFIIASHSPFFLSIDGARVYDLDERPVRNRPWFMLENIKMYYDLFKKHSSKFEEENNEIIEPISDSEFNELYSYLKRIEMPTKFMNIITRNEAILSKANFIYKKNKNIDLYDLLLHLDIIE